MKTIKAVISYIAFMVLFSGSYTLSAQIPSSGTFYLNENLTLSKSVSISSGKTLTIINDTDKDITISGGNVSTMFTNDGILILQGNPNGRIIIDGGAEMSIVSTTKIEEISFTVPDGIKKRIAIRTNSSFKMDYVTIQNVHASGADGAALYLNIPKDKKAEISNCTITKCYAERGSALMISSSSVGNIYVEDSQINYCFSGKGNSQKTGGAIRTYGSTKSSLYLTNVTFRYNRAFRIKNWNNDWERDGSGGAIFWNARGLEDTKCSIEGCLFEYNVSDDNGGAIKTQASIEFVGEKTYIQNNVAPVGAGLYIEGYIGSSTTPKRDLEFNLSSSLVIKGNRAPSYLTNDGETISGLGAGIHLWFSSNMDLEKGSRIFVTMNGATIEGNSAEGPDAKGGGIYFENSSKPDYYDFFIFLNDGKVINNTSAQHGGGIYVYEGDVSYDEEIAGGKLEINNNKAINGAGIFIQNGDLSIRNGDIIRNKIEGSGNGGGIYIENGDFTIDAGEVSGNTLASGQGAGVYIVGSEGKGNFTMNGGSIMQNTTSGNNGGGVYINGGNFTLNSGSITGNSAEEGGGVYLNNGNFSLVTGEISGNTASGNGGGVYLVGEDCEYRLKNGTITGNQGENGGGVYLANGSFILADSIQDIGSISGNTASGYGGGVYIAGDGDFTMNGGMVKENKTTGNHGGGIFLNGGNFSLRNGDILDNLSNSMGGGVYLYGGTFIMEDGNIAGNSSTSEGGGACIVNNGNFTMNDGNIVRNYSSLNGGGVYLDGGTLTVSAGTISNNASTANGGGLYIMNGTVTMGSGMIQENECGQYGGGVYVYNSSSDQKTVTFNGGTLSGNSAKYGGGVCVDGLILMTIGNVEIAENTATNGGGVCLMNSAYMEFGIGQIKNNTALTQTAFNTGFQKEIYEIEGFGGGVYLGSGTTLVFKSATELGLFGNHADNGGDEIFANGKNTKVDLPDVSKMALGGYPGASNLKWIEDYPTNDPNYDKGTKLKGNAWDTDKTNLRYRETISQNATIYNLSGATSDYERYICFALGYEIVYITITRYGLKHGESAIYHLRKNDANDFQVILTGNSEGTPITKKVAVTAGDWTVTETSWTWAYQSDARSITRAVPDPEPVDGIDRPFAFEGTRATTLPMNHEDIEVNVMGN